MIKNNNFIKVLSDEVTHPFRFSICTLVSKPDEYREMVESFLTAGFNPRLCEYLCIDNSSSNCYEAFSGINRFLREAKGKYLIICHQDIVLHDSNINDLNSLIEQMDSIDSKWAILSNAGGINFKYLAMHVTQKSGKQLFEHFLPLKASTVDENFIVVKKEANLALSDNLSGFHMYGTDICLVADILGYTAYIIDFNLTHKSDGNVDKHFLKNRNDLMRKYRKALRGRFVSTTITRFYLSGNRLAYFLGNLPVVMFFVRQYYKYFRSKSNYHQTNQGVE
ncbi:hypothetical protein GZH53_11735 [Flavihumibacter sp. R14]|nr:hypothetical protein [Flavihumibacter soli]